MMVASDTWQAMIVPLLECRSIAVFCLCCHALLPAGFTALREALGMTSPSGADEPLLSSEEEEDDEETRCPAGEPAAPAAAAATAAKRVRQSNELKTPEQRAAHAAAVQQELEQARSLGGPEGDWDLDWMYAHLPAPR